MAQLVDYYCGACAARTERWVMQPIPPVESCPQCGAAARRLFGVAQLVRAAPPDANPSRPAPHGHAHDVPGACTLTDTAARILSARGRSDNRALDREIAYQESMIKAGRLDPTSSPMTTYPGGPVAAPAGGPIAAPAGDPGRRTP